MRVVTILILLVILLVGCGGGTPEPTTTIPPAGSTEPKVGAPDPDQRTEVPGILAEIAAKRSSMTLLQWQAYKVSLEGREVVGERAVVKNVTTRHAAGCSQGMAFATKPYVIEVAEIPRGKVYFILNAKAGDELAANIGQAVAVSGTVGLICDGYGYDGAAIFLQPETAIYELLP